MGTILVELVLRVPFLAGDTDADQLKKTFHAMGTPTEEDWPVSAAKSVNRLLMLRVINNCQTTMSWGTFPRHSGGNTYHPSAKMDRILRESCSNSTPKQDLPLDRLYTIASLRHYHGPHHQSSFPSPWLNSLLVPWRQTKPKASHCLKSRVQQRNERQNHHAN